MNADLVSELSWRGLLQQATHEQELREHLASGQRLGYAGFDPTADSLTIGNLVAIKLLMHLQRAGHTPVAIVGGGTGLIGDPSGKSAERQVLTREVVAQNVEGQRRIFERLLDSSPGLANRARIVNNHDWLGPLSYIDVLRDIGKHFSVNAMIQRDAVRDRLQGRDQGISYTEFSYILLQAYDFYHLRKEMNVTLQMGGSDQWGNIVSGCDLIRRLLLPGQNDSYGLTAPLVTKADGGKFGKTETGAIWLTADRTSPYQFYQFWLNTEDRDLLRFLQIFTLLPQQEIAELYAAHEADPGARTAHRALARHMTELCHGPTDRAHAEQAAQALFSGEVAELPEALLDEIFSSVPSTEHARSELTGAGTEQPGLSLVDLLARTTLVKSKREAREFLAAGSITLNGKKVGPGAQVTTEDLLHNSILALRRGKKAWHVARFR